MDKSEKEKLIKSLYEEAKQSTHPFPEYAVFEVILETGWCKSDLFIKGNSCFGLKQSKTNPRFQTLLYPTKEFINNEWVVVNAPFVSYPTIKDSFDDRTNTLVRLSNTYIEYKNALNARTGEEFIIEVSNRWSTDPLRGEKVLDIYNKYKYVFNEEGSTTSVNEKLSDFWQKFKDKFKK